MEGVGDCGINEEKDDDDDYALTVDDGLQIASRKQASRSGEPEIDLLNSFRLNSFSLPSKLEVSVLSSAQLRSRILPLGRV